MRTWKSIISNYQQRMKDKRVNLQTGLVSKVIPLKSFSGFGNFRWVLKQPILTSDFAHVDRPSDFARIFIHETSTQRAW